MTQQVQNIIGQGIAFLHFLKIYLVNYLINRASCITHDYCKVYKRHHDMHIYSMYTHPILESIFILLQVDQMYKSHIHVYKRCTIDIQAGSEGVHLNSLILGGLMTYLQVRISPYSGGTQI